MRFSLQDMVRQTLAEAEEREKVAQLQQEPDRDESKKKEEKREGPDNKTTPKETGNTPERNYESYGEKTSSVFVEKLASAVEFLNAHFIKEAVGEPEPPLSHGTMHTTVGPGIGQTSLETNVASPTPGMQSTNTGEAKTGKPPLDPGTDVKSLGQTNPGSAMETDRNSPPGGSENWTHQDKMKQAADALRAKVAFSVTPEGHKLDAAQARTLAKAHLDLAKAKKEYAEEAPGKAHFLGGQHMAVPIHKIIARHQDYVARKHEKGRQAWNPFGGMATKSRPEKEEEGGKKKKAEADFMRIIGIMDKMAGEDVSQAHFQGGRSDVPPDATKSEEGVPKLPGEASRQENLVGSNQGAIDYTKQQAKAVPKARMGEVIDEPAQRKSTDPVLHENLDATSGAGVKISSAEQGIAARALLRKIAEEGAKEDASPEEKERADKLQEALKAKQEEKKAAAGRGAMPISGGY